MKCIAFAAMLGLSVLSMIAADPDVEKATLTKVGDAMPAFSVTALDGKAFDSTELKGKVVVLSFFATWCGPCREELPHVEKEIWQAFRDKGIVVMVVSREEPAEKVAPVVKKEGFTFPVYLDLKRAAYSKFATKYIPRLYVIDQAGKIAFQSSGYNAADFAKAVATVKQLVETPAK